MEGKIPFSTFFNIWRREEGARGENGVGQGLREGLSFFSP